MALWSFPIISDLAMDFYGRLVGRAHPSLRVLSLTHSRVWQALILDDQAAARKAREHLAWTAEGMGLTPDQTVDLDDQVLDDLMDVVTQRFHRTPFKASTCGHILLHIARHLTYSPEVLEAA